MWCYNGTLPGPVIRAKLGEKLSIQVHNRLDVPTTVHWHGMHQIGTWRMDGVAGVSQEPIPPGESFDYEFVAQPAGTHWYHSHTGVQYPNGLIGPLIVDEPTPIAQYDRDEILLVNDWFVEPAEAILAGLLKPAGQMPMKMKPNAAEGGSGTSDVAKPDPATADKKMPMPNKPGMKMPAGKGGGAKPAMGGMPGMAAGRTWGTCRSSRSC